MANFKYFAECGGEAVQLQRVWHSGQTSKAQSFTGACPACGQQHQAVRKIQFKAFPSRHECNAKCLNGHANGVCECKCGGKNHGRGSLPLVAAA